MSARQRQILEFVRQEVARKGYPPSVREIGEAVGLRSSSTVHGHLRQLEQKGYLHRDPTKPRALELRTPGDTQRRSAIAVPVIGRITAGLPILAVQNIEEYLPLPAGLFSGEAGDGLFILRVQGDSMVGAGIIDGDWLVVERQATATNGDIVVALLEDEATVKRFYNEGDRIRLQPENSRYQPIYAQPHEVKVLGKAVGIFRRLYH